MFKPEDFQLPLEKELRVNIINKEIDECSDINALKEQLKTCAKSLMSYQHVLGKACEYNLEACMNDWLSTMGIKSEEEEANNKE